MNPRAVQASGLGLVFAIASAAAAQDAGHVPQHRLDEARAKAAAAALRHAVAAKPAAALPADMRYYHLRLDLDPAAHVLRGHTTVRGCVTGAPLGVLALDFAAAMGVDSVRAAGAPASFSHALDDLAVTLDRVYADGECFEVDVFYGGVPDGSSALHFDMRNGQPLIWTLSEPYGSRTWWPCQDTPADKADSAAVDVTVPSNLLVVSNGTLAATDSGGGRTTYRWRERYPIAPYLVSIAAHPYTVLSTTYPKLAGGRMPVTLWAFPDQVAFATPYLATTVQILQRFAALFGEYPFADEKYDIAQFPWGGGMEHQTATSQCCWNRALTVHEAAHQWWGDAVTCESFQHIWLNEGFATYGEALWDEAQGGPAAYRAHIAGNRFYGNGTIFVPAEQATSFGRIFDVNLSYNKASLVLHMLRGVLGDAPFFAALRAYIADPRYAYGTATTEAFRDVVEATTGRDLDAFFHSWIYTPYFPTYLHRLDAIQDAGGAWKARVTIEQLQTQGLYAMPIQARVTTAAGTQDFVLQDSLATQTFDLAVAAEPLAVTLDPDDWILCSVEPELGNPTFHRGLLLVNGVAWSVGSEITAAYADSVFSGGLPFSFWDGHAPPTGGYVAALPPPLGHGALPPGVLEEFSTVVWVADSDLDYWNDTAIVAFLRAGGNLLLLGRRGQEYLHPSRSSRLGLRWAESASATLGTATAALPGLVSMAPTNTQSGNAVFETGFDAPGTVLLLRDDTRFAVPRGVAAWRQPPGGGSRRAAGAHLAFVSGRPYRWQRSDLKTNVRFILTQLFGEPMAPSGGETQAPPAVTRLLAPVPNPFNPRVRLRYEIAAAGPASLRIYTVDGRSVRMLFDRQAVAGRGEMFWDGRDERGRDVSSGVYVARLAAGGVTNDVKITLVR